MPWSIRTLLSGVGNLNGVISAPSGYIYQDLTPGAGVVYVNIAGGTVWTALGGGGGGGVASVSAGDSTISIGGTGTNPTVRVVPTNLSGIPQSSVINLVSDIASKVASVTSGDSNTITIGGTATAPTVRVPSSPTFAGTLTASNLNVGNAGSVPTLTYGNATGTNLTSTGVTTLSTLTLNTHAVSIQTTAPVSPATGDIWIDIS